jgi:glucose-6-phosphate-specific signal transduction histidine kinase
MNDRLSTRNILRRKNMHLDSYNCVMCQLNLEETVTHLFLECSFAKNCWNLFNIVFGANSSFPEALPQIRSQINSQFFMILAILLSWLFGWQGMIVSSRICRRQSMLLKKFSSRSSSCWQFGHELKMLLCLIYGPKICCNFSGFFDFFSVLFCILNLFL